MADNYPQITIELDDADIKRLNRVLPEEAERGVKKTALLVEASAVGKAPVAHLNNDRKGTNLVNSINTEFSGHGFDTEARVKATASYAIYVHEGTGIYGPKQQTYEIRPVNKKALFWPGAEHPVKKVTIRGMQARPFLKEAFEEEGPKLKDLVFGT